MKRRKYTPEFKAQVVLESLTGQKSQAQICREHNISPDLLCRWRQQFLDKAHLIFASSQTISQEQKRIAELERLVGRLAFELEAAKKLSSILSRHYPEKGR